MNKGFENFINSLDKEKSPFLNRVENRVQNYIENRTRVECLTIISQQDHSQEWPPEASATYVKCLKAFCFGDKFQGHELDSKLSPGVVSVVSDEYSKLYQDKSDQFSRILMNELLIDNSFVEALSETALSTYKGTIPGIVKEKAIISITSHLKLHLVHTSGDVVANVCTKAVTKTVSSPIAGAIAKLILHLLSTHLKIYIVKFFTSTAFKAFIVAAVKKVAIAAVLTFLAKFFAAKFGITSSAALVWILIPVILAYLAYEVHTFPKTLSVKVSRKVREKLASEYTQTNRSILDFILEEIMTVGKTAILHELSENLDIQNLVKELIHSEMDSSIEEAERAYTT